MNISVLGLVLGLLLLALPIYIIYAFEVVGYDGGHGVGLWCHYGSADDL